MAKKKKNKEISKAERRKQALELRNKKLKIMIVTVIAIVALCGVVYISMINNEDVVNTPKKEESQPPPPQTASEVKIPISEISNDADFYTYDADGVEIRYFTVIGSDDEIHVGIDGCDVCYGAKKGYTQIDDVMHCINCGREFPINSIGSENTAGGCWPSYIPVNIDDENVVVKISDLETKRFMFS